MCNHIFISVLPHLHLDRYEATELLQSVVHRNQQALRQVGVIEVEIPVTLLEPHESSPSDQPASAAQAEDAARAGPVRIRLVCSNPSGHKVHTNAYLEMFSSSSNLGWKNSNTTFKSIPTSETGKGPLDGLETSFPYPPVDRLELRRLMAKGKDTTYCYDFLTLFEEAIRNSWSAYMASENDDASVPRTAAGVSKWITSKASKVFSGRYNQKHEPMRLHSIEMVLNASGEGLAEVTRPPGQNDVAMVVWKLTMSTPEYPEGREIMLIINDVTLQNGSFGVREDQVFLLATEFAQARGIPRIFVAANTGARIGLVDEVRNKFRVQWKNSLNPASGMEFLYLDEDTVDVLRKTQMAHTQQVTASDGSRRHRLTAVVGPDGIGVENLRGSGKIAGGTCRAYDDIFTLTFVSGTAVGIGAYLVRLGQRAIQKGPPILLTGEAALNKVLGKKVYSSNYQLGGTQIMYNNGISHEVVDNDLQGVAAILRWLSFVPARRGAMPRPLMASSNPKKMLDPLERKVFDPRRGPDPCKVYDPRILLKGNVDAIGKWRGGLFDRDSFVETMGGWGKTTICGRARLGGMAVGVVMPELRTVQCIHPADPADPESKEQVNSQAGQEIGRAHV
jgi:acetyl-CoA carboxylase/biotin carboxylase 1